METTKIYDKQFTEAGAALDAYADFVAIVRQLRRDCPWDREQTHESVKHLLIEEAYETLEAIDNKDWDDLKKELGDLLLHVVFHSVMAEEDGRFTMREVVETESEKLIRRHPHVFGETEVTDVNEVLFNWEQIKLKEGEKKSVLQGVPQHLPALLRAYRTQEKAAGVGFDFPERNDTWDKVKEEIQEFQHLVEAEASAEAREEEFGDLLFSLVNYARFVDINPENALQRTNNKFVRRFRFIEEHLSSHNQSFDAVDLEALDILWEQAKTHTG